MDLRRVIGLLASVSLAALSGCAGHDLAARRRGEVARLGSLQAEYQLAGETNDAAAVQALDRRLAFELDEKVAHPGRDQAPQRTTLFPGRAGQGYGGAGVDPGQLRAELTGLMGKMDPESLERREEIVGVLLGQAATAYSAQRRWELRDQQEERRERLGFRP